LKKIMAVALVLVIWPAIISADSRWNLLLIDSAGTELYWDKGSFSPCQDDAISGWLKIIPVSRTIQYLLSRVEVDCATHTIRQTARLTRYTQGDPEITIGENKKGRPLAPGPVADHLVNAVCDESDDLEIPNIEEAAFTPKRGSSR
jgi:hypothetical protein